MTSWSGSREVLFELEAALIGTRLVVALTKYERAMERLPETLEELVPKFLTEIPLDPYDRQPMRYSRQNRAIYSIGTDLVDRGPAPQEGSAEEPTFFVGKCSE